MPSGRFGAKRRSPPWLFRITTNVFLDDRKRARAHPTHSLDEYMELDESSVARQIEDPAPSPADLTEEKERASICCHEAVLLSARIPAGDDGAVPHGAALL